MIQEQILKGNQMIALFMGGKFKNEVKFYLDDCDIWLPKEGICRFTTIDTGFGRTLHYHDSWDWLMPVVEKIELQSKDLFGAYEDCIINGCGFMVPVPDFDISIAEVSKIAAVYVGVLKYIEWYNSQKEK